jgi:hypothetical protein
MPATIKKTAKALLNDLLFHLLPFPVGRLRFRFPDIASSDPLPRRRAPTPYDFCS